MLFGKNFHLISKKAETAEFAGKPRILRKRDVEFRDQCQK
jgi:hypothetical protein